MSFLQECRVCVLAASMQRLNVSVLLLSRACGCADIRDCVCAIIQRLCLFYNYPSIMYALQLSRDHFFSASIQIWCLLQISRWCHFLLVCSFTWFVQVCRLCWLQACRLCASLQVCRLCSFLCKYEAFVCFRSMRYCNFLQACRFCHAARMHILCTSASTLILFL